MDLLNGFFFKTGNEFGSFAYTTIKKMFFKYYLIEFTHGLGCHNESGNKKKQTSLGAFLINTSITLLNSDSNISSLYYR